MQLVLSGKRIIAHGDGFISTGGTVINPDTGAVYQNATIAECDCCPADIDSVGYEYHAGVFVPCPPYGTGTGNIAVWCDDCKTPLDSGVSISDVRKIYHTTYIGIGSTSGSVTCGFKPQKAIITGKSNTGTNTHFECVLDVYTGHGYTSSNGAGIGRVTCTASDTGLTWQSGTVSPERQIAMNESGFYYSIMVFG